MFVAALVACSFSTCYRMGLYSNTEFTTKEDCINHFSFIAITRGPPNTRLRVRCMAKDEYLLLPKYDNQRK